MKKTFTQRSIKGSNKQLEQDLQAKIINYLKRLGAYCVKTPSGVIKKPDGGYLQLCPAGTPDVIACLNGKFIAIEVKKDDKTAQAWLNKRQRILDGRVYDKKDTVQNQVIIERQISFAKGDYIIVGSYGGFVKCLDGIIADQNKISN